MNQDRSIITLAYAVAMTAILVYMVPSRITDKALALFHGRASQVSAMAAMVAAPVVPTLSHPQTPCPEVRLAQARARFVRSQVKLQAKMAKLQAAQAVWSHLEEPNTVDLDREQ